MWGSEEAKEDFYSHLREGSRENFINTDVSTLDITRGEGHGEGETGLLGSGVMGPAIAEGMPQGSVSIPMTPMYTPYQQPQVKPGFGLGGSHTLISPRGDGLGASQINPSGHPRFLTYTVGHPPLASQQNPTGFNPRTPGGPPIGYPRGPPRVSSKVFPG